ncbi:hypothetical protein CVT25_004845 [Psilocybe cyanescens]|uniref:Uncharacterized protein n=1 Tax=Psilocybe cyanescens TaxID=93625 RepID=A0A409XMQ3_PSICY|nr:hypothetical protein CVT25_004845 [Psilocybe cyanescens]
MAPPSHKKLHPLAGTSTLLKHSIPIALRRLIPLPTIFPTFFSIANTLQLRTRFPEAEQVFFHSCFFPSPSSVPFPPRPENTPNAHQASPHQLRIFP